LLRSPSAIPSVLNAVSVAGCAATIRLKQSDVKSKKRLILQKKS